LGENTIILDTSPVRGEATQWAAEYLPASCHYAGFTPLISPRFLQDAERQPDANLFAEGLIAISIASGAEAVGMQTAAGLAELLKATPLFADILEVDSHMAALHILPQLLAGALSAATSTQPGWQDGTKFAGRAYALASNPTSQDAPAGLAVSAVMNKQNSLRVLDGIIAQLQEIRGSIEREEVEKLEEILVEARKGRETWWEVRGGTRWSHEGMPEIDRELTKLKPFGRWLPERKIPERPDKDKNSPGE
jgi:prephenate dehydrogenase